MKWYRTKEQSLFALTVRMDFSDSELITALGEIQYGLISSSIETKLEKGQARAKLNLLEPGITVNIVVSEAGWSAVSKTQDGVS